jgi:outer membrane protein TolC
MYEVMVGLEIPIYRRTKQSKMIEESVALLESSKSGLLNAKNDLGAMVTEDYVKAKSAEGLVKLYKEKIIPQAALAVESSLAAYRVDKTDFLALLSDINTYYSYQMAYFKELADLWSAVARLEQSSGTDVVNWGEK